MIDFDKHHDATDTVAEIEDELKSDIQRSSKDIKDDKIEFPENQSPAEEIVSVSMAFPIMTKDLVKYRNKSGTFFRRKIGRCLGIRDRESSLRGGNLFQN